MLLEFWRWVDMQGSHHENHTNLIETIARVKLKLNVKPTARMIDIDNDFMTQLLPILLRAQQQLFCGMNRIGIFRL